MLNKIIDGISEKLYETFGGGYTIYTESVKQDLKEPCFFIQLINPGNKPIVGERYMRENLFCIQYFPKNKNKSNAESFDIQDKLYHALEYIAVGGNLVRGIGMHGEIFDGVLSFFVSYNMFIRKKTEELIPMGEIIKSNITVKG